MSIAIRVERRCEFARRPHGLRARIGATAALFHSLDPILYPKDD
ncbi:MAG: hypothetical protein ABI724_10755 [Betaproteobacteria bacterium]